MYTVVEIKGHQYKLSAGDMIDVERIEAEVGATLTFDQVLLVGGTSITVGAPVVSGAKVTAKVVKQGRTRKILVLKRKPGAYRRKNGHRQCFTGLLITEISDGKGGTAKAEAKAAAPRAAKPKAEAKPTTEAKPKAKAAAKPKATKSEGAAKPAAKAKAKK